jgi:CARDB
MRRTLFLVLAALVLPASASAAAGMPAQVRLVSCAPGDATFEGDMRAVRGTARMQMRFTLLARTGHGRWRRVTAPRLDSWVTSDPGKLRYVYDKHVDGLVAPASYRMRVRFRWLDAAGVVTAKARRKSRVCRQPDLRPDLRLKTFDYVDGRYLLTVRNTGRSDAGSFAVTLTPPGAGPLVERVAGLPAGKRVTLEFEAPPCAPGSVVRVAVDSAEAVDEAAEADNVNGMPCPAGRF